MVRRLLIIFCIMVLGGMAKADVQPALSTLVSVQNVSFEQCTKIFKTDSESLFYLTIASINANRFNITEIQSKTGYIVFNAVGKEFLASIVKIDNKNSILRITPVNNVYYFQPGIILNIFRYIELNIDVKPTVLLVR